MENPLEQKPTKHEIQLLYKPKEITQDIDTGVNIAHFEYSKGIRYCELLDIKQTTNSFDLANSKHFIVCCGDVMVVINKSDYPEIKRRIF